MSEVELMCLALRQQVSKAEMVGTVSEKDAIAAIEALRKIESLLAK